MAAEPERAPAALGPEFTRIFRVEFGYVWNTLQRLGVPRRDLEDVAHDVFVAVFRHFSDYDPTRPIRPWLCGFAYRVASDYRRLARNRYEKMGDEALVDGPSNGAEAPVEARDLTLRALRHVELDRRVVLVMHDIDGYSAPDIAQELAVSVNTVYSRLRIARDEFRQAALRLSKTRGEP